MTDLTLPLLAAHMVGDYVLQTDRQATGKFDSFTLLVGHCLGYTLAFTPLLLIGLPLWALAVLFFTHVLIDRQRLCTGAAWKHKPFFVDQTLHIVVLAVIQVIVHS